MFDATLFTPLRACLRRFAAASPLLFFAAYAMLRLRYASHAAFRLLRYYAADHATMLLLPC